MKLESAVCVIAFFHLVTGHWHFLILMLFVVIHSSQEMKDTIKAEQFSFGNWTLIFADSNAAGNDSLSSGDGANTKNTNWFSFDTDAAW